MTIDPAPGQREQRRRRAAEQLELEFGQRQAGLAGDELALVAGKLDLHAGAAHAAHDAPDVGGKQRLQQGGVDAGGAQRIAGRRAVVAGEVELGLAALVQQHHVVLGAREDAVAARLECLHPMAVLAAQAQRDAGRGQAALGRVEVARLQPHAARTGGGHRAPQRLALRRRHLELQLDLDHHSRSRRRHRYTR